MPIYEYKCQACDAKFEQLVRSMGDEPKVKCPDCGSPKTARALSVFAVSTGGGGSKGGGDDVPQCGRCGGAPGSCQS